VFNGIVHVPNKTEQVVFEAVVMPTGKIISIIVLVGSKVEPIMNGVVNINVISE
jgi:hypothetical protein